MAKAQREYKVTARELSIDSHGLSFLCVAGTHINGAYIAIINFGISAELSALNDTSYNANRIYEAFNVSNDSWLPKSEDSRWEIVEEIAEAINPYISKYA